MTATYSREILYSKIHKAIRQALFTLGAQAARTDFHTPQEVLALHDTLVDVRELLHDHAHHEENIVFPALEAKCAGTTGEDIDAHHTIEANLDDLVDRLAEFASGNGVDDFEATYQWYLDVTCFIADYMKHTLDEEQTSARHIQQNFTLDEIRSWDGRILGSMTPEQAAASLRRMLPATYHGERVRFLGGIRDNAPTFIFQGALATAREVLEPQEMARLELALDVALEPVMD